MNSIISIALTAVLSSGLASAESSAPGIEPQPTSREVAVQLAALDSVQRFWQAQGRLTGKTLVVDPRPALPNVGNRERPTERAPQRPAPRAAGTTIRLAEAIGGRVATDAELRPCAGREACQGRRDLASMIVGEPVINADTAVVVVGLSVMFETPNGGVRPAATYQQVTLVRTERGWRAISMRLAGEG